MALPLSYINQCLQLINFAFGGYAYKYIAGVYLSLFFNFTHGLDFNITFGISQMELKFNTDSELIYLQINLMAIFIMIMIDKLRRNIKTEQLNLTTNKIGEL